jgi:hypothetical protein
MDITIPNLKPGKHILTLKYSDPFSVTPDKSNSNALIIETPKAPPFISNASYKPTIKKFTVMKKVPFSYTANITNIERTSNVVTFFTDTNHPIIGGSKITLTQMGAGLDGQHTVTSVTSTRSAKFNKTGANFVKNVTPVSVTRYSSAGSSRIITATLVGDHGLLGTQGTVPGRKITISGATGTQQQRLNGTWTVISTPTAKTFTFQITTAMTSGAYTTGIGTLKAPGVLTFSSEKEVISHEAVKISLPQSVKDSLEWTNTLRDVVFFLYQEGTGALKYVDSDISNGGPDFTITPPSYPSLKNKRSNVTTKIGSGSYKFSYVIVRYVKNSSGNWIGYFPMLKKDSVRVLTINDIIVSAVGA